MTADMQNPATGASQCITERAGAHSPQFGTYALQTAGLLAALAVRPVPSCTFNLPRLTTRAGIANQPATCAQLRRLVDPSCRYDVEDLITMPGQTGRVVPKASVSPAINQIRSSPARRLPCSAWHGRRPGRLRLPLIAAGLRVYQEVN